MQDIIELQHWLSVEEITALKTIAQQWQKHEYIAEHGRFPGQLIATQSWHQWQDDDQIGAILKDKIHDIIGSNRVVEVDYVELHLPWDIHCDYERSVDTPDPYYTVLIPLEPYSSRTIFFNQTAEYNDFWKYKQSHQPVENPVDLHFWNSNLSHCWDEDRLFVSLRHVSEYWVLGNVIFFPRNIFHSSDDYHMRHNGPKRFLQVLTDNK